MYTVTNIYGISGDTYHATVNAALKARDMREGEGWMVKDGNGDCWDWRPADDGSGKVAYNMSPPGTEPKKNNTQEIDTAIYEAISHAEGGRIITGSVNVQDMIAAVRYIKEEYDNDWDLGFYPRRNGDVEVNGYSHHAGDPFWWEVRLVDDDGEYDADLLASVIREE